VPLCADTMIIATAVAWVMRNRDLTIAECDERAVGMTDNGPTEEVGPNFASQIVASDRKSIVPTLMFGSKN
jgi:hypothetical protein